MRVVCDTNVLVQAAIAAQGPANAVISLVMLGKLTPLMDERIWDEYHEVLTRKRFGFSPSSVQHLLRNLRRRTEVVTPIHLSKEQRKRLPDLSDAPFLEVALGGRAGALITSNLKHFPAAACADLIILSPTDFIHRFVSVSEHFP